MKRGEQRSMKKLAFHETVFVASMLFGMFFGAGNLIFPVSMGQMAGKYVWQAAAGFLITGVGLPLLGVAALGISRKSGLLGLASQAGRKYGVLFTCALYLTIGPFFAIPRCATVSYTVGVGGIISGQGSRALLAVFSFVFFAVVLFFSLRPGEIMTWIGKVMNPLFLLLLGILVIRALSGPLGAVGDIMPSDAYAKGAFFTGLLEGYNTMDALAGLAFGIVVVDVIKRLGVKEPGEVAGSTIRAGLISAAFMAVIYVLVSVMGAQSVGGLPVSKNGGEALLQIAEYYFGSAGAFILAVIVTMACLKTAVGLITSCGEAFVQIFPKGFSYSRWVVLFCLFSFLIANLGLDAIIDYSQPVLMFLYPLAIVLIILTLAGKLFGNDRTVFQWTLGAAAISALFDALRALPENARSYLHTDGLADLADKIFPLSDKGFGWGCPAVAGLIIGLSLYKMRGGKTVNNIRARFEFREIRVDEGEYAAEIERICFPPHEACSREMMLERVMAAPELFLVAVEKKTGKIAGFLNGLSTDEEVFRDEFFKDVSLYHPDGKNVMLLGLDVLPDYRRQGLATEIMREYVYREKEKGRKKLLLTCLESKVEMYEKMGFQDEGISASSWGGEQWNEMSLYL